MESKRVFFRGSRVSRTKSTWKCCIYSSTDNDRWTIYNSKVYRWLFSIQVCAFNTFKGSPPSSGKNVQKNSKRLAETSFVLISCTSKAATPHGRKYINPASRKVIIKEETMAFITPWILLMVQKSSDHQLREVGSVHPTRKTVFCFSFLHPNGGWEWDFFHPSTVRPWILGVKWPRPWGVVLFGCFTAKDLRLLSSGPRCGLSEINLPPKERWFDDGYLEDHPS